MLFVNVANRTKDRVSEVVGLYGGFTLDELADGMPRLAMVETWNLIIDGIAAGVIGDWFSDCDGRILSWRVVETLPVNTNVSCVFDLWRKTPSTTLPTVSNTICGSATKPTLSSAKYAESAVLTSWTPSFTGAQHWRLNCDSASAVQRATLALTVLRY